MNASATSPARRDPAHRAPARGRAVPPSTAGRLPSQRPAIRVGCRLIGAAAVALLASLPCAPVQATEARTALIVGISRYADPAVTPLRGVEHDMRSARAIARAMDIPESGTRVVRNAQATKAGVLAAVRELGERTREGSRAFLYFSGHGTRYFDPQAGGCVEGLLTYDGQVITHAELAEATQPAGRRADKLIVMLDACHSEGVLLSAKPAATRGLSEALVPKFSSAPTASPAACSVVANYRTRGLLAESTRLGALRENLVMITSARPDEVSFDEPERGGLATQGIRDCLLGKARDLDASGAVSLEEIRACAQAIVNERLRPFPALAPHTLTLSGNRNLVPVAVSRPPAPVAAVPVAQRPPQTASPPAAATRPDRLPGVPPTAAPTAAPAPPATTIPAAATPSLSGSTRPQEATSALSQPIGVPVRPPPGSVAALPVPPVGAPAPTRPGAGAGTTAGSTAVAIGPTAPPAPAVAAQPSAAAPAPTAPIAGLPGPAAVATTPPMTPAAAASTTRPALAQAAPTPAPVTAGPYPGQDTRPQGEDTPAPLASLATLTDIASQADPRRSPQVAGHDRPLRIGRDTLDLVITPARDGYLYLVLLGSDARSFYLLFPNGLDRDNRVRAGQPLRLPREDWRIRAAGPPGVNQLLVVVSDTPRALERLGRPRPDAGTPFTWALNTLGGRSALFDFMTHAPAGGTESFGARLLSVEEVK